MVTLKCFHFGLFEGYKSEIMSNARRLTSVGQSVPKLDVTLKGVHAHHACMDVVIDLQMQRNRQ